jgi:hypothetical protein
MTSERPHPGDVVVHKSQALDSEKAPYGLAIHEGLVQFVSDNRTEARGQAERFARHEQLDAWYTEDGVTFDCVARFRAV